MVAVESSFEVSANAGSVSARTLTPGDARALLVFGHGAGAGMRHPGTESLAQALARHGVATFRFQFPYVEAGRRFPDPLPVRLSTVGAAVTTAAAAHPALPLYAGGRSMGGRMASNWAAGNRTSPLAGLVFYGFPLHPPGKPGTARGRHLADVGLPMLFLSGTRDKLAGLDLLEPLVGSLGSAARLHEVEGADHGFHVPKSSGRTDTEVIEELAAETRRFIEATSPRAV